MPSLLIQADPQVERIIQDLELDSGQPYFNAAYRAQYRTEEGQAGTLQCEEGSYCIKEWWNTGPTTNTTSTVQVISSRGQDHSIGKSPDLQSMDCRSEAL